MAQGGGGGVGRAGDARHGGGGWVQRGGGGAGRGRGRGRPHPPQQPVGGVGGRDDGGVGRGWSGGGHRRGVERVTYPDWGVTSSGRRVPPGPASAPVPQGEVPGEANENGAGSVNMWDYYK
jgi:hypothetical protein